MKRNQIISRWVNGYDISARAPRGEPWGTLLSSLAEACQKDVKAIADVYSPPSAGLIAERVPPPAAFERNVRGDRPFLRPLYELKEYVEKNFTSQELLGFYVHGSLSTGDYVENYSDFDTVVVVRKEVLDNPSWLADFKRRLCRSNAFLFLLDPLQHHYHFFISEYDLAQYSEAIFPLHLFQHATEITSFGNTLTARKTGFHSDLRAQLKLYRHYFTTVWPRMRKLGPYEMKSAVQTIALLPALFVELKTGLGIYKRESFSAARPFFDAKCWSLIERATAVRRECPFRTVYPYPVRKWLGIQVHYKLLSRLHRQWDRDNSQEMGKIMGPRFLEEAVVFLEKMEKQLG